MSTPLFRIQSILCPTDFSLFSARALRHAAALARQYRAELHVLHVIPTFQPYGSSSPYFPAPVAAGPAFRAKAEEEMAEFVKPAQEMRLPFRTVIRDGTPAREIESFARERAADLVVMGTHGRSGFERLLLGSVAERLIHRLSCSVMTVGHEEGRPWETPSLVGRVLCAVDLSPSSKTTVAAALALAAMDRAPLTLLHVLEGLPESEAALARVPRSLCSELEAAALWKLQDLVPDRAPGASPVERRVQSGRAPHEILRLAVAQRADVIVVGAGGHGPLGLVLGSTSRAVVREASCPVLTVKPARAAGEARDEARSRAAS